ncbi:hypothetical protein [Ottowia cancrivicina]|uniref:Uncharacterized protein n=1 Tax=Ottowia cancrivicina TaxID=3040346 RepID=A0AAW6RQM9_9BURK|nr:hypothetical protein [Ottowia sp. 10c7w1]MDG9699985.1 hypothetical protein [Ottowia sp. 10c7w1]
MWKKGLIPLLKKEHDVLVKRAQEPFLALFNLLLLLMLPGGTMLWARPRRLRSGMPRQRRKAAREQKPKSALKYAAGIRFQTKKRFSGKSACERVFKCE